MSFSVLRATANVIGGAVLSVTFSNLISNKLLDIASDGLTFKKNGIILPKYESFSGKKMSRKVAKFKTEVVDFNQDEIRNAINRFGSITGTSLAFGTVGAANILIDKVSDSQEYEVAPFEIEDDDDEDDED